MKEFLCSISPSINFKVMIDQYKKLLRKMNIFNTNKDVIDYLIYKIQLHFNTPEMVFIRQGDESNKNIYFTG